LDFSALPASQNPDISKVPLSEISIPSYCPITAPDIQDNSILGKWRDSGHAGHHPET
jgi:hypothetical protein